MINTRIKNRIDYYKQLGYGPLKIVITSDALSKLKEELPATFSSYEECTSIYGLPIEVYDGIATDFYVTEIL